MGPYGLLSRMQHHRALGVFLLAGSLSLACAQSPIDELPSPAASAAAGPNTSASADFYVATNGNDAWPGTLAQPFKTVDHARVAVQALKTHVSGRTIRVLIRAGTYYLPSTWTFSGPGFRHRRRRRFCTQTIQARRP